MDTTLVAMAKRGGQSIRGIGCWRTVELQDGYDHVLHLLFRCPAGAHYGLLDLTRGVLEYFDIVAERRAQGRGAGVAQLQRTTRILVHEDALDGDDVGPILLNEAANRLENLAQAIREPTVHAPDGTARNIRRRIALKIENGEPGQARAWIDA